MIAQAKVPQSIAAGQAPGHQTADTAAAGAAGAAAPGPVDSEPLALLGQLPLQLQQGHAGLHGHREVAGVVVEDPV